ncbi:3-oxoacyl-(acyl-carrier-protein) synthase [Aquimarina intermedia]|uniref:3-oxoacyl-(Acyl-carrier-protein) synthase n=2 Tax=Aquimarina intermedia TaxID=350814 RepID=A0A5S5CCJ9_9FLAO|nr:3-oxoacyl-(acyl-carrier-protein) synthase [Aquimarina intermedia]
MASVSPLGMNQNEIWEAYTKDQHKITSRKYVSTAAIVAELPRHAADQIAVLRNSTANYQALDNSVLYGLLAARNAFKMAGWDKNSHFGINVGSSRGATSLFEKYHEEFLAKGKSSTLSSPTTTLGNISSWIAHDLQSQGPEISHSITCSTALHALLNGVAWIQSGLTDKFLVGGSEAPLTAFTIEQMKALKIYAADTNADYPCQAMNLNKKQNSMFLGEGAGVICMEKGVQNNAIALVTGIGFATEPLQHNISISTEADCFQKSMKMALQGMDASDIDVVVMHAPGTIKGDQSEYNAIKKVFGSQMPALTTNKWKIGHTFGASGILSLEFAILMLVNQKFINIPFVTSDGAPQNLRRILVNAVGFGGNAVSVVIEQR